MTSTGLQPGCSSVPRTEGFLKSVPDQGPLSPRGSDEPKEQCTKQVEFQVFIQPALALASHLITFTEWILLGFP